MRFKRIYSIIFIVVFLIIEIIENSYGGVNEGAGNFSGRFLKISSGARVTGMGGCGSAIGEDIESLYYNPSSLGYLEDIEININYSLWIEKMNYTSGFIGLPLKKIGGIGIGFIGMLYGDIPIVIQKEGGELFTKGETSAQDIGMILGYGRGIGKILSIGCNLKLIFQKLEEEKCMSFCGDIGVMKRMMGEKLIIGISLQNIGTEVKFMEEGYRLPLIIRGGVSYRVMEIGIHKGLMLMDLVKSLDNELGIRIGGEYVIKEIGFFRCGYQIGSDLKSFSIGVGVQGRIKGLQIRVDYACIPFKIFGNTHRMGINFKFD